MQRSFEGFVCFLGSNGRLTLPYFFGLPTDIVDLLLYAETMISKFCTIEEHKIGERTKRQAHICQARAWSGDEESIFSL